MDFKKWMILALIYSNKTIFYSSPASRAKIPNSSTMLSNPAGTDFLSQKPTCLKKINLVQGVPKKRGISEGYSAVSALLLI